MGAGVALAAVLAALPACSTRGPASPSSSALEPTPVPTTAASPTSGTASAPGSAIPVVSLATRLPTDPGATSVSQAALITTLSERVTDAGIGDVRTVECSGDLPLDGTQGVACSVTTEGGTPSADGQWIAYAARAADGSPAVLWLQGAPLSQEFVALLAAPDAVLVERSIDTAYGSTEIAPRQVLADANTTLADGGSPVRLAQCDKAISFEAFEPSVCTGGAGDASVRALVLPGVFLGADPGQLILLEPAA